jgi:hypothetical protein
MLAAVAVVAGATAGALAKAYGLLIVLVCVSGPAAHAGRLIFLAVGMAYDAIQKASHRGIAVSRCLVFSAVLFHSWKSAWLFGSPAGVLIEASAAHALMRVLLQGRSMHLSVRCIAAAASCSSEDHCCAVLNPVLQEYKRGLSLCSTGQGCRVDAF